MATYHLHKWSVSEKADPFLAPEINPACLAGYRDDEDRPVVTSRIVKVDGRTITTYSGSVYILEDIDPDYLQWLQDNGHNYDPETPIKFKKKS